jgi:dipeptide transport system substrate-binding protein
VLKIFLIFFFTSSNLLFAKTFIYCSEGSPSSFNPQVVTDGTSITAASDTLFNRLVEFEVGTTKIIPALAESYQISKDQLTYTFRLRKNVKFHSTSYFTPTRDLNADDVFFSIERQRNKNHPYHMISGGNYEYFEGMEMGKLIKDVKIINPETISITLNKKNSPFLANLSMSFMAIQSKEYADKLERENKKDQFDKGPIGTGPFILSSYQKDNSIKFTRHEKYWGSRGNIDKLIFSITPDSNVRTQKLKVGECQLIAEPSPSDIKDLKNNSNINVIEAPGMNVGYLAINTQKKPFDNLDVRMAIQYALNRKSYIDAIFMGQAEVAKNPIPPTIWSYNNKVVDLNYNPTLAKEHLKKAGFANGFDTELWVMPVARPYNPNGKKMGELMQADLKAIGINAKIVTYDWPTYLKKSKAHEHGLIQFGWSGDNGDPDNFLAMLLTCEAVKEGSNYASFCNIEFDDLIKKAQEETDLKKRTVLYEKAQIVFKKNIPWVTLAHSKIYRAMSKKIKGFKLNPLSYDIFTKVNVE